MKYLVIILMFSLCFCSEYSTDTALEDEAEVESLKVEKTLTHSVDTIVIETKIDTSQKDFPCGVKDVEFWIFDHYEPVTNKI